jgi:hypothetical protein
MNLLKTSYELLTIRNKNLPIPYKLFTNVLFTSYQSHTNLWTFKNVLCPSYECLYFYNHPTNFSMSSDFLMNNSQTSFCVLQVHTNTLQQLSSMGTKAYTNFLLSLLL